MTMSQRERRASGRLYVSRSEGMTEDRMRGKELMYDFNHSRPGEVEKRREILGKMLGGMAGECWIEPPLYVCYGSHVFLGEGVYMNMGVTLVDDYTITIGNRVLIGPNVTIATSGHPVHPEVRMQRQIYALPITIGDRVWIGAGAIICPGVTIGENAVIGAGSVVTRDVPANCIAVGNPCKVLREVTEDDRICYVRGRRID
ncbi:DapH/DapD/GlmU-related protein [Niveibacterium sp. SC-1]|uniref:DapH/DapD/GlmU-related protein n=1 Tax=Niveibacterium sp. SC-1 TaxID=3135646 RepID=UPI00311FD6CF